MHRVVEEIVTANEWRDGEFAKFKVNSAKVEDELWCRMCIPMIYAHWEGYVVSSLKILIDYLNELELNANELPTKFIVIGLSDAYSSLSGKQSLQQRAAFTDRFRELLKASVKFKKRIDTKSNLKSDVLEDLCTMYGFDFRKFFSIASEIDRLVSIRNSIAHGENSIVPTPANVAKYIDSVSQAMDIFREEIEDFLKREEYLPKQLKHAIAW